MTAREREVAALSRRLAKGIVADLVNGHRRAAVESNVVAALRSRAGIVPGGKRPRNRAQLARRETHTFIVVPLSRVELELVRKRARGESMWSFLRQAVGLSARMSYK